MIRLCKGDVVGIASPSWLATADWAGEIAALVEGMGFRVRMGDHLLGSGWGYTASREERAADFNQLLQDEEVRLIFFGGGEGADDIVPLLDFESTRRFPRLYLSYSDGTSILNPLWAQTGHIAHYGQTPGLLKDFSPYDRAQFEAHLLQGTRSHTPAGPWRSIIPGRAEGTLAGGYLSNFVFLAAMGRIPLDRPYVLLIEDHEMFSGMETLSAHLGRLESCGIMPHVTGLLFGHYSTHPPEALMHRLRILGETWNIPVAYCDDFGHGPNHAILPIGAKALLDTRLCTLDYTF